MNFTHKLHLMQGAPQVADLGKQQEFLTWANSLSFQRTMSSQRDVFLLKFWGFFPEEVQRASVINSVKRADLND